MQFLKEYLDLAVFAVLFFMSFLVLMFSIERFIFFAKAKNMEFKDEKHAQVMLSKNLTCLYIVYQNAPYVGLLGTVCGIMITFYDIANSVDFSVNEIIIGLSLVLKATALGLLVAIPTLILYNIFLRKVEVLQSNLRLKNA
ncbi:TonB-system energizer ExbB [Campylobacter canadensis]|uniref:TonB-system energizer ExbB n=1 Tax=Campylobacter canadensis TaxID=449520 RepID=UPI001553F5F5|nr:TonB-system energizer ExbB [Campylobacter canadensis]MBZ7993957.1 TonB-system energizer ExbB [Campylobacter canadensis]